MMLWKTRPTIVEAVKVSADTLDELFEFVAPHPDFTFTAHTWGAVLHHHGQRHLADVGDWIVRKASGELCVLTSSQMVATYELVNGSKVDL